jgi:hypothetical protein
MDAQKAIAAMDVRTPGFRLIPFAAEHVGLMDLREVEAGYRQRFAAETMAALQARPRQGPCFTALVHGSPIACFGLVRMWPGVAEAWLLTDRRIKRYALPFTRAARKFFDCAEQSERLHRVQITCDVRFSGAVEWASAVGFVVEARLHRYGPDGTDHILMRRSP